MKTLVFIGLCAILAVVLLPENVSGLQCYVCNNYLDKSGGCGHGKDVSPQHLKDCNQFPLIDGQEYDICRKIVTVIEFDVNNNTHTERIDRRCGYIDSNYDETCYYRGGFGGRQRTCSCKTDGCNSAFTFGVNLSLLSVAILSVFAIYFKQF